jgi:hypothetical protein
MLQWARRWRCGSPRRLFHAGVQPVSEDFRGRYVLKRVFMAPDPGRVRLRFAARAVLGIGLAVVVCGLAGHSLAGAVTGGLAALLALFTVTDATVRGQALTTALLPPSAFPSSPRRPGSTTTPSPVTSPSSPWSARACTHAAGARAATASASSRS